MSEYVSQVTLNVNGQEITDFNSVTEKKVDHRKAVNLMNKTGFVKTVARYGVQVEYVLPKDAPEFNFAEVQDATLTVDKDNGRRVIYTGVACLEEGDVKYDGEKEATKQVDLVATGRVEI